MVTYDEIREKYLKYHSKEDTTNQYVENTKFKLGDTFLGYVRDLIVENEATGAVNNDSLLFSTNIMPSKVKESAPNYKVYKNSDGKIVVFKLVTQDTDTSGKEGEKRDDNFIEIATGGKRVNKTKRKKNKKRKSNKRL
jgi:hypothetical protein